MQLSTLTAAAVELLAQVGDEPFLARGQEALPRHHVEAAEQHEHELAVRGQARVEAPERFQEPRVVLLRRRGQRAESKCRQENEALHRDTPLSARLDNCSTKSAVHT